MNDLSNRAYAWLMTTLIVLLILGLIVWRLWAYGDVILHYTLIGLIILAIVGVLVALYLAWHHLMLHHYARKAQKQQLLLEAQDREAARQREADRMALEEQREADRKELELEKIRLEQMKATLEHQRLQLAQRSILLNPGQTAIFPEDGYLKIEGQPAPLPLPGPGRQMREQIAQHSVMPDLPTKGEVEVTEEKEEEKDIPIPEKPLFWDIADLITPERMPLCFVVDEDPASPTYGQTVPQFGKVDDLLSLAVIGKPGKGKTVLLTYYSVILTVCGAEVHIFDPHGVMGELALLHGRPLPGMPATARIYYYDRKETMMDAVRALNAEMLDRDLLYRPHLEDGQLVSRKTKHPLLILADELTILADFDEQIRAEYKERNQGKPYSEREQAPSLMHLFRRTVLEARKWRMFFCGSSQSIDASVLPTKVTDALNSRIVFFNSDRKARLVGLEADVIKKLLPVIRRAGPGMTVYDCARWDKPKIGAIPNISIDDMLQFLGVDLDVLTQSWLVEGGLQELDQAPRLRVVPNGYRTDADAPTERLEDDEEYVPEDLQNSSKMAISGPFSAGSGQVQNVPQGAENELVEPLEGVQNAFIPLPGDKLLTELQQQLLIAHYEDCRDVKECLRRIKLGVGTYYHHACYVLDSLNLRKKRA
jgi:hypothetical protein